MDKSESMKNTTVAILFYCFLYLLLFFFTLNFNYVEGDDAATVLYHLCGHNPYVQKPYAAYNSGMDFLLRYSGLHSEQALRVLAVSLSFISGLLVLVFSVLLLETLFDRSEATTPGSRLYFYLILPFLMPDMIFHSLIVNSSNISFVFLLVSLLLFIRYLKGKPDRYLICAMLFFAISIPFRWTMLIGLPFYAGFFLYFHPLQNYPRPIWLLAGKIFLANIAAVILSVLLIRITGYDLDGIRATIASATGYLEKSDVSILGMTAAGTAFLTPALLLLVVFAFVRIYTLQKSRKPMGMRAFWLVLFSASPFFLLGFYPLYKYSMTFLPALFVLLLFGFDYLRGKYMLRAVFMVSVFVPWLVGIQIDASGTFCGPGFEISMDKKSGSGHNIQGNNPDKRVKIEKVRPAFASGFYMPMPEGPRPLYGYAYVVFGGWKSQIAKFTSEREAIFAFMTQHKNTAYFQDRPSSMFACDLYRHGFKTEGNFEPHAGIASRFFTKGKDTVAIHVVPGNAKSAWIKDYFDKTARPAIFRSSYSNDMLKLQAYQSANITFLGPFTAIKPK